MTIALRADAPWSPRSHPRLSAGLLLALTIIGAGCALTPLVLLPESPGEFVSGNLTPLAYIGPYAVVGSFLVVRRPDLPFGWLLAGCAAVVALGVGLASLSFTALAEGADGVLIQFGCLLGGVAFLPLAVQGLVNVRFPTGRVTSRFGRVLHRLLISGIAIALIGGLLADVPLEVQRTDGTFRTIRNPLTHGSPLGQVASGAGVAVPVVILLGLIAGLAIVRRAWRATGIERAQLQWRAYGVLLSLTLFPLAVAEALPGVLDLADGLLFTTTLVIPIVRYRLWAIDTVIRRSAGYLVGTLLVAAVFAAMAVGAATVVGERIGLVVAAAVTALTFGPALRRSQRVVDELFYGHRTDPYLVLSDLSRRLDAVTRVGTILPTVVTAVAESLRLPYVAIERPGDGSVLAQYGELVRPDAELGRWPLMSQGIAVGTLVAAPRRGEVTLDGRDRAVLADLARQAGAAVHAEALTADLLASRQRIVEAREEERRRLRRDLHDGLGPLLTTVGLNLDALRAQVAAGDGDPLVLVARAKGASAQAIADLRTIVHTLRPPALDDLGLVGAVTAQAQRLAADGATSVTVEIEGLPALPAAIEVAVFRVAIEGVTNAVRHSRGGTCVVRVRVEDGTVIVEVEDDGPSRDSWTPGVGTIAMSERTHELGGTLDLGPTPRGGRLLARFPLTVNPIDRSADAVALEAST